MGYFALQIQRSVILLAHQSYWARTLHTIYYFLFIYLYRSFAPLTLTSSHLMYRFFDHCNGITKIRSATNDKAKCRKIIQTQLFRIFYGNSSIHAVNRYKKEKNRMYLFFPQVFSSFLRNKRPKIVFSVHTLSHRLRKHRSVQVQQYSLNLNGSHYNFTILLLI